MNYISFVVDKLSAHYYQAELLLYSLERNTSFEKKNIIVQCLNRVDEVFLEYLSENNYNYNIIEPYLDGKYCNKLMQLEYFKDKDVDGIILMDTDMFVIDDLEEIRGDKIIAKRVDAPNPLLSTLKNIYNEASLQLPRVVESDWCMLNNETLENNFNGGFYYIPKNLIRTMSDDWKKWGEWLYNRPELFEIEGQFIHVDQISFSLALHSNKFAFEKLSANYNFPIHSSKDISSFESTKNIKVVHYHREVNKDGLLSGNKVTDSMVLETIKRVNQMILEKTQIQFSV